MKKSLFLTKESNIMLARIIASAALLAVGIFAPFPALWRNIICGASYLIIGYDVLCRAMQHVFRGAVFDENFLMSVATIGALCIAQFPEAVAVMLFYQIGELLQDTAVHRSRREIKSSMDIRPDFANLLRNGATVRIALDDVMPGDLIVIRPGERVPLDCVVEDGSGALDTSALTGESVPRSVSVGDELMSGCLNQSGVLTARAIRPSAQSTASRILDLVETSTEKKAKFENFITKFARIYTPVVVLSALALALIPPLFSGFNFATWVYRALVFLVISCPCALVISVPLTYFSGLGCASKNGILIKGSNYLDALAGVRTVVFDKTGTLTRGVFSVSQIVPDGISSYELLELAALAESMSTHPISMSICAAYKKTPDANSVRDITELSGLGVRALVHGKTVLVGSGKLLTREGIAFSRPDIPGTIVLVASDGKYVGAIAISDELKSDSREVVARLRAVGVRKCVMLTGDAAASAMRVADAVHVDEVYAELLPGDKVAHIESLLCAGTLAFVGDGINDAPSLARADIGVAMGGIGSDAAIEAADVVLMTDETSRLADAIMISRGTRAIVRQNIVFSLAVKIIFLILGALGVANMWEAVFADVGVSIIAILNATRAMRLLNKR